MAKELFTAEWFPYYFDRFNGSGRVARLSLAEEGAYHRAIRFAWEFGSVPSDPEGLAAVIQKRCTVAIAAKVLQLFVPMPGVPSQCIHPTVEEIREEQYQKYVSARERGEKGAEKRWGNKDVPPSKKPPKPPKNSSAIAEPMQDIEKREEDKDSESDSFSETDSWVHACVDAFPDVDRRLVEIAVIRVLITHRNLDNAKPIRSSQYFRDEINDLTVHTKVKLGEKAINAMLHSHRQKAEKLLTEVAV